MPFITGGTVITSAGQISDGIIGTADLADGAVTLPKQAAGTPGGVLVYDAAGAPTDLGVGVAGQVVKSQGANLPPAWGTAGVLFSSGTSSPLSVNTTNGNRLIIFAEIRLELGESADSSITLTYDGNTIATRSQDIDVDNTSFYIISLMGTTTAGTGAKNIAVAASQGNVSEIKIFCLDIG